MRLANVIVDGQVGAAVRGGDGGLVQVCDLDRALPVDVDGLLAGGHLTRLRELVAQRDELPAPREQPTVVATVRRPGKILGIGLNYVGHAADLDAPRPDEPAVFWKGAHTVVGPGEPIELPPQSERVTAEAELALVIGAPCWEVEEDHALEHVAGAVPVLDQTAEDILQRNPRFLVRAKNFPGFLAVGPELVTLDELVAGAGTLEQVTVTTRLNGADQRRNAVAAMTFSPARLVSFLSHVMPLHPGDLLCTGTPGAAVVTDGDQVECDVAGLPVLRNPVVRRVPAGPTAEPSSPADRSRSGR